ncbi:TetR/AcrR family transcriptional regulator [Myxococcota bacterium]|nr:TetR/AcrR family transcriptional regulator [Myxococcota bacterium]
MRILDATAAALSRGGTAGFTMEQVAAEAGYSTASLYNYFRSRDDLVLALVDRCVEQVIGAVEAPMPLSLSPEQRLESILLGLLQVAHHHRGLVSLLLNPGMAGEAPRKDVATATRYKAVHDRLLSSLKDEVGRLPWMAPDHLDRLTYLFFGMVRTESFAWTLSGEPDDLSALAHVLMRYWLAGARAASEHP